MDDFQNNLADAYNNLKNRAKYTIKTKSDDKLYKVIATHGKVITTYCKSFLKSDNPVLVELLPKKPLQSLITVVTLLSYSTTNLYKSYIWITLSKYYYNLKITISGNQFPRK